MTGDKRAVLFDLDGTLIDTAPDMVRLLAEMIDEHGGPSLPYETVRSVVSNGSLGLIRLGFPDRSDEAQRALQAESPERYARHDHANSPLFPGLAELLSMLEDAGRPWGIVTNKPTSMTQALLRALALDDRAACVVCGDTLPQRKPDPAPLLFASEKTAVRPADTVYVGDAARDIEAGRAAGMTTIAAAYGYIVDGDSAHDWQADAIAADTGELARLVARAVELPA